ncbi:MAG TPA: type II secretion system protein [Sedimentisphaerales bacterium]|nr:type II secretion system protein [Sedimentisphaerales bacterium]
MQRSCVSSQGDGRAVRPKGGKGFSLTELMVVLGIIAVMMGILLPALGKARRQARAVLGMSNQRQIVSGLNLYAIDNDSRYPESVATIGFGGSWHWQDPRMLTAYWKRDPGLNRSMSAYLRDYIEDAGVMFCPSAPVRYPHLQASWDAGEAWDNPDTDPNKDPVFGTYCFYWNYLGILENGRLFKGPSAGQSRSKLLVSDYFGYGHWRSLNSYGSCEAFKGASVTPGEPVNMFDSAYWSARVDPNTFNPGALKIKLHAGYVDGHVADYSPSQVVPMRISKEADGSKPYPDGTAISPGIFYLPKNALR